jgi:hypothetical protein
LKFAETVTDEPPSITVPTAGISVEVKTPLLSKTVVVTPFTVVDVRLWNTDLADVTDVFVYA